MLWHQTSHCLCAVHVSVPNCFQTKLKMMIYAPNKFMHTSLSPLFVPSLRSGLLLVKHWTCHEADCMLDLWRSPCSFPSVCLDVALPPAVSLHISAERWAKYCVSFTRPTNRAPPPNIRQGHTNASRLSL